MPRQVHLFERPTRFVAGTVGQPGDRTFYLQASDESGRTVSVALEKSQVQVLADRMNELLDEVAGRANTVIPPEADVDDLEPLTAPVECAGFRSSRSTLVVLQAEVVVHFVPWW